MISKELGSILAFLTWAVLFMAGTSYAQTDPGVQSGDRGTGATLIDPKNDPNGFLAFFQDGSTRFNNVRHVPSHNPGLGPRFNSDNCTSCHAHPAPGGSGALVNPQFLFDGGIAMGNTIPSFITQNGPTLIARFPFFLNPNGTINLNAPNGGVEDLFTITGRLDAGTCNDPTLLPQPNFAAAIAANDIIFRIPTPTFGDGLVENLDDSTLLANQAANLNNNFGIAGTFNHNGNDGTISRFGWKAQNPSLHVFTGEAFDVEMGITNELFPQERPLPEEDQYGLGLPSSCLNLTGTGYPEDTSHPQATPNAAVLDDVSAVTNFQRFLAPPLPGAVVFNGNQVPPQVIAIGGRLFASIGCATCHNSSPGTTQVSNFVPAMSHVPVPAFSDFEIHHMGTGLADNVSQGTAGGDQFRTAPLWGVGQRNFLLHDGRTTDLIVAIQNHASQGSEANVVVGNFFNLSPGQQQEVLDFIRSL